MVVYTWWCWHICKEKIVGVEKDQLGEETEAKRATESDQTLVTEVTRRTEAASGRCCCCR
jgi:hypothetical protein